MNLKIKCDTPKEQVLVLRKFKKLVPDARWGSEHLFSFIPFIDSNADQVWLYLYNTILGWDRLPNELYDYPSFNASDFLRNDWKLETDNKAEIKAKIQSLETQLNELKDLLNQ